jgi:hypothetical protein
MKDLDSKVETPGQESWCQDSWDTSSMKWKCCRGAAPLQLTIIAHHCFLLKAFNVNSTDYILKPVDKGALAAFRKYETLLFHFLNLV